MNVCKVHPSLMKVIISLALCVLFQHREQLLVISAICTWSTSFIGAGYLYLVMVVLCFMLYDRMPHTTRLLLEKLTAVYGFMKYYIPFSGDNVVI